VLEDGGTPVRAGNVPASLHFLRRKKCSRWSIFAARFLPEYYVFVKVNRYPRAGLQTRRRRREKTQKTPLDLF
jgi:hypothetical protein